MTEKTLKLCARIKSKGFKKVGKITVYVMFNSGSLSYLPVDLYDGLTFNECLYLSSDDIYMYFNDVIQDWVRFCL